jgi:hypothetical protein
MIVGFTTTYAINAYTYLETDIKKAENKIIRKTSFEIENLK